MWPAKEQFLKVFMGSVSLLCCHLDIVLTYSSHLLLLVSLSKIAEFTTIMKTLGEGMTDSEVRHELS